MAALAQPDAYLVQLMLLVLDKDTLRKHGFVVQPLTEEELLSKRRCLGCGKAMSQLKGREKFGPGFSALPQPANNTIGPIKSNLAGALQPQERELEALQAKAAPAPKFKCRYHTGEVDHKHWTCCDQHVTAEPCGGSEFHNPRDEPLSSLAHHHQFLFTPVLPVHANPDFRAVVALDCEMGTAESGDTELIKVTLIDYFTGEILVNNLVEPDVPMRHLNTKFSGVTWPQMRAAQRQHTILRATAGARHALWRFVGWETIVVGHGVHNDLRALKWIHDRVVDSFIIEFGIKRRREEKEQKAMEEAIAKAKAEGTYVPDEVAEPAKASSTPGRTGNGAALAAQKKTKKKGGELALKTLVERRLGRRIQMGEGTTGHDALEDAIAARDLVHWHITNPGVET